MKKTWFTLLLLVASSFFLFYKFGLFEWEKEYVPTNYEIKLIDYFKEIALQSEYDDNPEKIIKWNEPMILFIEKEKEFDNQMTAINKVIGEINQLATDGFKIILTNNILESNSILYLCSKEKVAELNPLARHITRTLAHFCKVCLI